MVMKKNMKSILTEGWDVMVISDIVAIVLLVRNRHTDWRMVAAVLVYAFVVGLIMALLRGHRWEMLFCFVGLYLMVVLPLFMMTRQIVPGMLLYLGVLVISLSIFCRLLGEPHSTNAAMEWLQAGTHARRTRLALNIICAVIAIALACLLVNRSGWARVSSLCVCSLLVGMVPPLLHGAWLTVAIPLALIPAVPLPLLFIPEVQEAALGSVLYLAMLWFGAELSELRLSKHAANNAPPSQSPSSHQHETPATAAGRMHPGHIAGYWPASADQTARTYGYQPVSECEEAIAAGTAGHGLVNYGVIGYADNLAVSVNGKTILYDAANNLCAWYVLFLEDAIFYYDDRELWKSEAADASDPDELNGVLGLEIDPAHTWLIPYSTIETFQEDQYSQHLVLTLTDKTTCEIALTPKHSIIEFGNRLAKNTKQRHDQAKQLTARITQYQHRDTNQPETTTDTGQQTCLNTPDDTNHKERKIQ